MTQANYEPNQQSGYSARHIPPIDWKFDVLIYHGGGCVDGFTCYWQLRRSIPWNFKAFALNYGDPFPYEECAGKRVLFVDFSLKRELMQELLDTHQDTQVVVLDHHETAEKELAEWVSELPCNRPHVLLTKEDRCVARFESDKCGSILVWEYLWDREFPPGKVQSHLYCKDNNFLLRYVDARDRWVESFTFLDEVTAFIGSFEQTLTNWGIINSILNQDFAQAVSEGEAILRFKQETVRKLCLNVTMLELDGSVVPAVNAPYSLASDVAHYLLQAYPKADFAVSFVADPYGNLNLSLRSEDRRRSVSEVAKRFGGGGHRNAAGCHVKAPYLLQNDDYDEDWYVGTLLGVTADMASRMDRPVAFSIYDGFAATVYPSESDESRREQRQRLLQRYDDHVRRALARDGIVEV